MVLLIAYASDLKEEAFAALRAQGCELRFLPGDEKQSYPDLDFSDVEGVVCYRFFCYNSLDRFPRLRFIQLTSHGTDHMPLDTLRARGIALFDARGAYSPAIAEFALCGVLQLYKCAPLFHRQQAQHVWQQTRTLRELGGQTVCIVGTGSIGTECARRFRAMGCRVIGLCRHPKDAPDYDAQYPVSALDALLPESDIVILTLPLTEESRGLFNAARIARMKPGAVLVNVSRGAVVESAALLDALRSGQLSGAVADVFETEPLPPDSPLWDVENLILTPHNSFSGNLNGKRLFEIISKNISEEINLNGGATP